MAEDVEEINYNSDYRFSLWCETEQKQWFEVIRSSYDECKRKMNEFEEKFSNTQLEILYMIDANY